MVSFIANIIQIVLRNRMSDSKPTYSEFCAADIVVANLFAPLSGVPEKSRNEVKILEVGYATFTKALAYVENDWLNGKVGYGAPTEAWDIDAIRKVNKLNGEVTGSSDDLDEDTKAVYDNLIDIKVPGHLRIVASHRRWICAAFRFCQLIGVKFSDQLDNLVWRHDLSKYSHKEVLGYAVMFGDGSVDFRQLQTDVEKDEWNNSLYNHYAHNPHHPEYFYPLQEDGTTRIREKSMADLDKENGQDYLDESIVDMLASRGERYLKEDVFSVKKLFDMPERFMGRYAKPDQKYVLDKLKEWSLMGRDYLAVEGNAEKLRGIFDERAVVYDFE